MVTLRNLNSTFNINAMVENLLPPEKDIDDIQKFMSKSQIFKGLSSESLRKITEKMYLSFFNKDSTIIKKRSKGTRLYLIKSGSVRVVTGGQEGEEFTVAAMQSGACFGELSLLTGNPCIATVKTDEDSQLYYITKHDFDNILSKTPLIYRHFHKLLVDRLNEQHVKSVKLKKHEVELNRYFQKTKEHRYGCVIGKSKKIKNVLQDAENLSKIDTPFTIIGAPGTGKELLARKIHRDSERAESSVFEILLPRERRV